MKFHLLYTYLAKSEGGQEFWHGADVSAIGAAMIPPLTKSGYKPEEAVSVVAAASAMGILVPPCILMIIIGATANVAVAALYCQPVMRCVIKTCGSCDFS